jgi:ribonuclease BN (tRNA processing enzyme)
VHIWGPASSTQGLKERLGRYLSPPLFPVRLRDLPSQVMLHDVPLGSFVVGEFTVEAALVCHPGPTVGYRISDGRQTLTYLPDHEPALGSQTYPGDAEWLSGYALAADADLLIHDAQYSAGEYPQHVGWGHSSIPDTFAFAAAARVRQLVTFHHDPEHPDDAIDWLLADASRADTCRFEVIPGTEGTRIRL